MTVYYFNLDNTDGWDIAELDELNRRLRWAMRSLGYSFDEPDDCEAIKTLAERIETDYDVELCDKAGQNS